MTFDFKGDGLGVSKCEVCGGSTKIKDSRKSVFGMVRRRRYCVVCGEAFSTYESRKSPVDLYEKIQKFTKELNVLAKVKTILKNLDDGTASRLKK